MTTGLETLLLFIIFILEEKMLKRKQAISIFDEILDEGCQGYQRNDSIFSFSKYCF